MAGHSQFKNIMHRKGAQDARRAKIFTKIGREIVVAAKTGGGDPSANPRLRAAIVAAREVNMPGDRIKRAIDSALGGADASTYESIRYEGYGPGGVAIIVEALTDNRTRTVADVRVVFTKYGGNLGETNSVSFMFNRCGEIVYPAAKMAAEAMFEAAVEAGAEDVASDADGHVITCAPDDFAAVREALEKKCGAPERSALVWQPVTTAPADEDTARTILKMVDLLEDNDDVQSVTTNMEVSAEVLKKLAGE